MRKTEVLAKKRIGTSPEDDRPPSRRNGPADVFLLPGQTVGENGHLHLGGCDAVELARKYGTPLYVMDEAVIRERCREYTSACRRHYPEDPGILPAYASKAFLNMTMARIAAQEGLGLDVVSGGELHTAVEAGFPTDRIVFHGNNKTPAELKLGIEVQVGRFIVDNLEELELLESLAAGSRGAVKPKVLLRVTPGVQAHTHDYVNTGIEDSKFGFTLRGEQALRAAARAASSANLVLTGFAAHIGSQILETEPMGMVGRVMVEFAAEVRRRIGFVASELDLGGGLGVRYVPTDDPPSMDDFIGMAATTVRQEAERLGLPLPGLIFEVGRAMVAEAGTTLYTVGGVKHIPGIRTYASVDGGMTDNPRLALYGSKYMAVLADRADRAHHRTYAIAGRNCESGDMLIWRAKLPTLKAGDTLAVLCTGAYNYSMASNYNRVPILPVVLVHDGQADLIVKGQTWADMTANDLLPARFAERNLRFASAGAAGRRAGAD
ncbi:MAG TPA: diaminopimelate decarboxylase [Bacillota bacterium]